MKTYNKNIKYIFLLLAYLTINLSFSQNDCATIYVYRPSIALGFRTNDQLYFNNKKICVLKNGGYLEYKVFTENKITISVHDGTEIGSQKDRQSHVSLNVSKGKTYYFKTYPKYGKIQIEQLTEPINKNKLNHKEFISLNDIGTINENPISDTDWNYNKLIEHWNKNGVDNIEGIYERVSAEIEYSLAILKENNEYKIIYLAGARGTGWLEGDIKATLRKTAQFGLFKSNWRMIDKTNNKDLNIIFESATMKTLSETGDNSQDLYLKMYPTYENDVNSSTNIENANIWKSTGTGFFIDKKGYIATNHHVIEKAKEVQVNINKKSYLAKVVISDERSDLAILKIIDNSFIPLSSINYNFNDDISEVGNSVFALGFPLTQYMGEEIKFTDGKINSKSGYKGDISTYQISVPIQPGNSGGPLFDNNGTLVGITSSGLDKSKTDNVNYAIKTKYLKLLIDEMTDKVELPKKSFPKATLLPEKIKTLSNYVVWIKIK